MSCSHLHPYIGTAPALPPSLLSLFPWCHTFQSGKLQQPDGTHPSRPASALRNVVCRYELQFGTNHLGHFTLTNLLARHLAAAGQARVVNLASTAHSMAYPPQGVRVDDLAGERLYTEWGAYGQSKLANVLHAQELEARFQRLGADVRAYSVHPGVIATDLWRYSNPVVAPFMRLGINVVGKSIPQGAATTVYCALAPDLPPAYYADCNEGELSHPSFALDPQLRTKLWDASVELTGTDLKLDAAAEVQ